MAIQRRINFTGAMHELRASRVHAPEALCGLNGSFKSAIMREANPPYPPASLSGPDLGAQALDLASHRLAESPQCQLCTRPARGMRG